ncbi:MAG: alkaline phosphatase family protein [Anaerolineales bacterium]|nr:alkaline phosphatase family protein [Anaerolineales bacterium]
MRSTLQRSAVTVLALSVTLLPGLSGCRAGDPPVEAQAPAAPQVLSSPAPAELLSPAASPSLTPESSPTPRPVPALGRVFIIVLENREFSQVVGNATAPNLQRWIGEGGSLTEYYAVDHPSFPNYLALIAGDTFGIDYNCEDCYQPGPMLADQVEASGRDWRAYVEGMPEPCFDQTVGNYAKRHNPFVYFETLRRDPDRCQAKVVPFPAFWDDLNSNRLPDLVWLIPDICNGGHDCALSVSDAWLAEVVEAIRRSTAYSPDALIAILWEEGASDGGCCGLAEGGKVAVILLSPLLAPGAQDHTLYTHYSLLKTLEAGWGLDYLGHAADPETALIEAIWRAAP